MVLPFLAGQWLLLTFEPRIHRGQMVLLRSSGVCLAAVLFLVMVSICY